LPFQYSYDRFTGISSLIEKLNIKKLSTTSLLVVFVVGGSLLSISLDSPYFKSVGGVFGGPDLTEGFDYTAGSLIAQSNDSENNTDFNNSKNPYIESDATIVISNNPSSTAIAGRDGNIIHTVQSGENLSIIAAKYGVSLETIIAANDASGILYPGDELLIPSVSGILHPFNRDESIDAIAALYEVSVAELLAANEDLSGRSIVIPGATELRSLSNKSNSLPDYSSYYMEPTDGLNWGVLHYNNAVDLAEGCGAPVFASAEGLVIDAVTGGWNGGYGRTVIIEHPNETETLYAHLQDVSVSEGDFVAQGDVIGQVGNSGRTSAGTGSGCHVHFEVLGAKNPFAR
jgi:murein DD-endopeptidase MepM/ murein hydrolase activator NlpD